ncbi:MAG TPA: [Fe-Fe] hydrogenase large subunit C-terminal domain-containing protein, partial [Candidatus Sulfotelmatobacter sp.]|nr:[Fe-Fe] hydrogenase large subunit C-terminal domain-containing protein [Candidatus Sulfotelmatobacter sp.]
YPQLIPHLSSCKSPQQMMGATVKNHFSKWANIPKEKLFVVSIVPCLAKKQEAARPEFAPGGIRDVDAVLTTMEMIDMLKLIRFDTAAVKPMEFDPPYRTVSSAGVLFGASGGVAEAALRMAVEKLTGKPLVADPAKGQQGLVFEAVRGFAGVKEAEVKTETATLRVAVVSGLRNAEPIIERILKGEPTGYDLIEVMACPGGCICGAGHPVPEKLNTLEQRQGVLVEIDATASLRKSQENPDLMRLYQDYFGSPNSHVAHKLLHTTYKPFTRTASSQGKKAGAPRAAKKS